MAGQRDSRTEGKGSLLERSLRAYSTQNILDQTMNVLQPSMLVLTYVQTQYSRRPLPCTSMYGMSTEAWGNIDCASWLNPACCTHVFTGLIARNAALLDGHCFAPDRVSKCVYAQKPHDAASFCQPRAIAAKAYQNYIHECSFNRASLCDQIISKIKNLKPHSDMCLVWNL